MKKNKNIKGYIRFFITALLMSALLASAALASGCSSSQYIAKGLTTTNSSEGWICTFDSLTGDYVNTFPINGKKLKIVSSIDSGSMNIVVENALSSVTLDGSTGENIIEAAQFGEGTVYITLSAENAGGGSVLIVWVGDQSADAPTE